MHFLFPRSLVCTAPSTQGHVEAALHIGTVYSFGQGVAVDDRRALAAYKIGAKEGNANCQHQVGVMLSQGYGCDVDYKQALVWLEKAAAQHHPAAHNELAYMAEHGLGRTPSWRRARELYQRALGLGSELARRNMQTLNGSIQAVTRSHAGAFTLAS